MIQLKKYYKIRMARGILALLTAFNKQIKYEEFDTKKEAKKCIKKELFPILDGLNLENDQIEDIKFTIEEYYKPTINV